MKIMWFCLLFTFKLSAQNTKMLSSEYELTPDSAMIYAQEIIFYAPEGNDLYWQSDYSEKFLMKKAMIQFPFMLIYFPIDMPISSISICNTILVTQKETLYLLFPGEYRMHTNEEYQYIICRTKLISADDSSLALSKHVYFRPW